MWVSFFLFSDYEEREGVDLRSNLFTLHAAASLESPVKLEQRLNLVSEIKIFSIYFSDIVLNLSFTCCLKLIRAFNRTRKFWYKKLLFFINTGTLHFHVSFTVHTFFIKNNPVYILCLLTTSTQTVCFGISAVQVDRYSRKQLMENLKVYIYIHS